MPLQLLDVIHSGTHQVEHHTGELGIARRHTHLLHRVDLDGGERRRLGGQVRELENQTRRQMLGLVDQAW